ncbi:MAG: 2-C-methyl-D-erythritol 2,4-cyclodiphosphate synthase [bacterium]|nr:2-C-methyl-D-erythritol 2,4-cyclodiphosphate synthase [bacterium]
MNFRIGYGFDIHPLVSGRDLFLGGIKIPFHKGLDGDSDADVVIHAIIDSILGGLGAGDIGRIFGVGKPELMGISSLKLLERVVHQLEQSEYTIGNIDVTIIAEEPKLSEYIAAMQMQLRQVLHLSDPTAINIKATTAKKIGPLGAGEGIAAIAVVLLEKRCQKLEVRHYEKTNEN